MSPKTDNDRRRGTHLASCHKYPCAHVAQTGRRARCDEFHRVVPQGYFESSKGRTPDLGRSSLDLRVALRKNVAECLPGLPQEFGVDGRHEDVLEQRGERRQESCKSLSRGSGEGVGELFEKFRGDGVLQVVCELSKETGRL